MARLDDVTALSLNTGFHALGPRESQSHGLLSILTQREIDLVMLLDAWISLAYAADAQVHFVGSLDVSFSDTLLKSRQIFAEAILQERVDAGFLLGFAFTEAEKAGWFVRYPQRRSS